MSGNKARARQEDAQNIERHIELVQPRKTKTSATEPAAALEEKERIRAKIQVRAAGKKVMADQILKEKAKAKSGKKGGASRLIPAEGGGMGMQLD